MTSKLDRLRWIFCLHILNTKRSQTGRLFGNELHYFWKDGLDSSMIYPAFIFSLEKQIQIALGNKYFMWGIARWYILEKMGGWKSPAPYVRCLTNGRKYPILQPWSGLGNYADKLHEKGMSVMLTVDPAIRADSDAFRRSLQQVVVFRLSYYTFLLFTYLTWLTQLYWKM